MKPALLIFLAVVSHSVSALADERQECRRHLADGARLVDCIERGIYDPCDDATGSLGIAQCAWAHVEVAERRIKKAENKLLALFDKWKLPDAKRQAFLQAEETWRAYRKAYCGSTDALAEYYMSHSKEAILAMDTSFGFCSRRLSEVHADELERAASTFADEL